MAALNTIANQSQLRQKVRAVWRTDFSRKYALILKMKDRFETVAALRNFATELGARAIILDIDKNLTEEQIELLRRPGPRLVIISGLETMAPEDAGTVSEAINSGGRALPIIIWSEEPAEEEASDTTEEASAETAE